MPYIEKSSYSAPLWLPGGHAQTIYPLYFRKFAEDRQYIRHRIETPDDDFFDIDILQHNLLSVRRVAILSHGLEGNSRRHYMRGMSDLFFAHGWDCLLRNFRCCSGEMNRQPGMYHSGQTEDLHTTVQYAIDAGYSEIVLIGFSMGGNQVLKYLGEKGDALPLQVVAAVAVSVPCDLTGSAKVLGKLYNRMYMNYFMQSLRQKVRMKHAQYPHLFPLDHLDAMQTFDEFDEVYTAPLHGFSSAHDYWEKSSSLPFLAAIKRPTLLINALNDPFLSPSCFPYELSRTHQFLHLETPSTGGHVGFMQTGKEYPSYWSDRQAVEFIHLVCQSTNQ